MPDPLYSTDNIYHLVKKVSHKQGEKFIHELAIEQQEPSLPQEITEQGVPNTGRRARMNDAAASSVPDFIEVSCVL